MFFEIIDFSNSEIRLKTENTSPAIPAKGYVPSYHFSIWSIAQNCEIGRCNLRVGYNDNTYYGGNIGYEIQLPFRGHHFASQAVLLLEDLAKLHQMPYLIISCRPDNIASRKTAEKAGYQLTGIFPLPEENELYKNGNREECIYQKKIR